jgi:eukaryotic-like serine/threonine-protein kinase
VTSVLREPLLLPEDVLLTPVTDMPAEWRNQIGGEAGDIVISRPGARATSKRLDAHAAALLECFRTGRTIVQAVLAFSRAHDLNPERTLEEALPTLRQLIADGLLVPEGSHEAERIVPTLKPGALFADYQILRCIQLLDDSELYQARSGKGDFVALKLARPGHEEALGPRLAREAAVLRQLDGTVNPALVEVGEASGRFFLTVAWHPGVDAGTAAADARATGDRGELLRLLTNIVRAYSALHRQGVVHGDVHVRNVLVGRDGAVTLIDYGLAELLTEDHHTHQRGGVSFFYEPEWARALIRGQAPPMASAAGEQYGVAALLYLLATGRHYVEFNLERETMLRQIADLTPLRFEEGGAEPWPELETVLRRALAKRRDQRYPDMGAFADALEDVITAPPPAAGIRDGSCTMLVGKMLEYLHPEGTLYRQGLPAGPVCSVNLGAAGIAYTLYRLACARDDPDLLAAADIWISRALRDENREDAFANPELGMTPEIAGRVSLYHSPAGVHLVRALIARAAGNSGELTAALTGFLLESRQPSANRDLALGRCGTVLGCALLLEAQRDAAGAPAEALRTLGSERLAEIWDEVGRFPSLEGCDQWPNLGMAHGWAGLLYTTLRWRAVTGEEFPGQLVDRLAQLRECARPSGRGLSIPWRERVEHDAAMPGWCNGSAGLVHLGCLAYRMLGEDADLALAEGAAWDTWEAGGGLADLCCGLAGRAYALLALHRVSGDAAWLRRAGIMAHEAARIAPDQRGREHPRHSLYKGELGLTLLLTELERAESACMPLFEEEG